MRDDRQRLLDILEAITNRNQGDQSASRQSLRQTASQVPFQLKVQ